MIFATIGTTKPFDRLLRALDDLDGDEELVVQCGESPLRPEGARCLSYLTFDDLVECVRSARVVVAHAGVGTIMTALANGKRPVVVPRLARLGEAVDDHQVSLARRLAADGIVTLVEDTDTLPGVLSSAIAAAEPTEASPDLAADVRRYLESVIGARS